MKQQAVSAKSPTNFDPPLVAIAYNAGSLRPTDENPWGLVQTMRDVKQRIFHVDAYLEYFNDFFALIDSDPTQAPGSNTPSFWSLLQS
ncbi:hypothetical protein D3C81_2031960 [compost metagenome]